MRAARRRTPLDSPFRPRSTMTAPNAPVPSLPGTVLATVAAAALLLLLPQAGTALELSEALAQGAPARRMRDFWHVFAAYAIAWLLLGGWVVAIVRRLGRVESRLAELPDADQIRDGGRQGEGPSA
ncbi:MAG: CcmD family protein [Gemmatimonadales bacterium]|nr:MAG: CcmD family protein [Gemmatimonadales bacterium]